MTLVELMLAMTLFSMIMATVTSLVQQAMRVSQQLDAMPALTHPHELALAQMADDIEHASRCYRVPFVGAGDHVELARVDAASHQWVKVVYRFEDRHLIRDAVTLTPDGEQPRESRILMPVVDTVSFEFGWRNPTTKAVAWHTPWPEAESHPIPQFTRMHVAVPGARGSSIPRERIARNVAGTVPEEQAP